MCTAITLHTTQGNTYFGRTMDFSYPLDPELYAVPKGYEWKNLLNTHRIRSQYSFFGIGQDLSPVIFADGVNERGFAAAVLYFPGYASYDPILSQDTSRVPVAAIELTGFLLSLCASVEQALSILRTVRIVGVKDSITDTVAPLHWLIADKSGACAVVEKMADGLHLMENPIGVLSNSPDFRWHMTNLRNYMEVSPSQRREADWSSVQLAPLGQGGGSFGLPGDYTPPSRFVRTAYQKSHVLPPSGREEAVSTCFHLLEGVSIPKGVVMTERNTPDYTQYTAFIDLSAQKYYYKTYDNSQVRSAGLPSSLNAASGITSLGKLSP